MTGIRSDRGVALVVVLLVAVLLSALGLALSLMVSTERGIAAGYAWGADTFYAAEAGIERAVQDLSVVAEWNDVLGGLVGSSFVDGMPGPRLLGNGWTVDLIEETDLLNCGHPGCSGGETTTVTADRPWGSNNPIWRLFGHGAMAAFSASASSAYVAVWVADDPLENDGAPLVDGNETAGANPGKGILQIRAQAYGPSRAKRQIEVTIRRAAARIRVLSWREIRQ